MNKIYNFFKKINSEFKYKFNKQKIRLLKESFSGYPYDYSFFYTIQLRKLEEMYSYFETSKYISEESRQEKLKWLKLAIKTLRLGYMDGEGVFDTIIVFKNPDRAFGWDVKCSRYVNLKNKHRFESKNNLLLYDCIVYNEKARCLYHKILKEKSQLWWD